MINIVYNSLNCLHDLIRKYTTNIRTAEEIIKSSKNKGNLEVTLSLIEVIKRDSQGPLYIDDRICAIAKGKKYIISSDVYNKRDPIADKQRITYRILLYKELIKIGEKFQKKGIKINFNDSDFDCSFGEFKKSYGAIFKL